MSPTGGGKVRAMKSQRPFYLHDLPVCSRLQPPTLIYPNLPQSTPITSLPPSLKWRKDVICCISLKRVRLAPNNPHLLHLSTAMYRVVSTVPRTVARFSTRPAASAAARRFYASGWEHLPDAHSPMCSYLITPAVTSAATIPKLLSWRRSVIFLRSRRRRLLRMNSLRVGTNI